MPPQYTRGIPNTNDPVALAEFIVKHGNHVAPIDMLQLGVNITREFGGMKQLAKRLKAQADNTELPPRDRMRALEIALQFLQKTAEIYPRPYKPHDLTIDQIAACIRYASTMAETSERLDDPGDAFGR